jgi:hypothetical protein
MLRVSCVLQEFKFDSKCLGYLKGHCWRTDDAQTEVYWLFKLNWVCCVTDICQ